MRRLMNNSTALALSLAIALPPAAFARTGLAADAATDPSRADLQRYAQATTETEAAPPAAAAPATEGEAELLLKKKLEEAQKDATAKAAASGEPVKPVEPAANTPEPAKPAAAAEEAKPADAEKPAAPAPIADKPADTKPVEAKPVEPKPAQEKPAAVKPAEPASASTETKAERPKPAEVKPAAGTATDSKAAETKPADIPAPATDAAKPAEAKAVPEAPAQPKPVPATPTEVKPAEVKAADPAKPAEPKPAEAAPTNTPATPVPTAPATEPAASAQTSAPAAAPTAAAPAAPAAPVAVPEANATLTDVAKAAAAAASAPVAAALTTDAQPEGKTVETTITDALARKSSQEFATSVNGKTSAEASKSDDKGLSDLESVALGGLAALAVGQLINNRPVALNTGDRVIVQNPDGSQQIIKNDNALLFQPGSTVETQNFADGSSRTTVLRGDGSKVVTIRDANYNVLRRTLVAANGTTTELIDDTSDIQPVVVTQLPPPAKPVVIAANQQMTEAELRQALVAQSQIDRRFTLGQIRSIPEVRALVAPVDIPAITFDTGSAAITPDQAKSLAGLGKTISAFVKENPREMFMIEGYTDTVGAPAMNLALSDRRAESVALALTEYFNVPPENMVVQGYGESFLRVPAEGDVRENRRVAVRRITDLMDHK